MVLAYQAMVLKRNLMILYQSATLEFQLRRSSISRNASSGMWAFSEGMEVMYMVVLLYLIWPIVFNLVGRVAAFVGSPRQASLKTLRRAQTITPSMRSRLESRMFCIR